jgi:Bacterial type II and III secretion system protein
MRCFAIGSLMLWLVVAGAARADESSEVSPGVERRTPTEFKPAANDDPPIPIAETTKPADDAQLAKDRALLAKKVVELQALQAEVQELRRATGRPAQLALKVEVVEISRTKMRDLGIDFSDVLTSTQVPNSNGLAGFMQMLKRNNVLKVLAEPTLVVSDGRPAYFFSGGEVLCPKTQADGSKGFEHRKIGTEVNLVFVQLGGDRIHLEFRAKQSEMDPALGSTIGGEKVPGFKSREIDTSLEMELGKTAILSTGIGQALQTVVDPETKRESQTIGEIYTVFLVTAESFADEAK